MLDHLTIQNGDISGKEYERADIVRNCEKSLDLN